MPALALRKEEEANIFSTRDLLGGGSATLGCGDGPSGPPAGAGNNEPAHALWPIQCDRLRNIASEGPSE